MDDFSMWNRAVVPLPDPGQNFPAAPGGPDTPIAPLPNPGQNFPAAPGGSNRPVVPLPNPGQNFPAAPGGSNRPVVPLPGPGQNIPIAPVVPNIPVVPLPNPGQNFPAAPGRPPMLPVPPLPNPPCYYCTPGRNGKARFLNAAYGYQPFRVYINNYFVVNGLGFAALTPYGRVSAGFQTVTVTRSDGYVYLQKSIPFSADQPLTIAIVNSASGLDLLEIPDATCQHPAGFSCFRVCSLASSSNPLDVLLADGRVIYSDVRFKEITSFKRVRPGDYQLYLAETDLRAMPRFEDIETLGSTILFGQPEALLSFYLRVRPNATYTAYILSSGGSSDDLQTLVVEDL